MSLNNYQWQASRTKPMKSAGVFNVNAMTMLSTQIEMMNKKLDIMQCDTGGNVVNPEYPPYQTGAEDEQMNYIVTLTIQVGGTTKFFVGRPRQSRKSKETTSSELPKLPYPQEKKPTLEEMMEKFSAGTEKCIQETDRANKSNESRIDEIAKSVKEVTNAIEQLTKLMSERPQGRLPSNTKINPKEQIQAITAQDSKGLEEPNLMPENKVDEEYQPRIPYPEAIKRDDSEEQLGKFLKLLKKLHINLPLLEALFQMPDSRKFLKQLLTNKRKIDEEHHVELNATCSVILQNRLPQKLKDPGSFTIPCLIGSLNIDSALADLGASINVMPYSLFKRLGLGKPKQTRMSIQLADKTVRIPRDIIEDVLVKIDKFVFSVDFVVLDMDEDNKIPLILGRPFLATAKTKIDVATGELILRVGDESLNLQALDSVRTTVDEGKKVTSIDNQIVQSSSQETSQGLNPEPTHKPHVDKEELHEEQSFRVDNLEKQKIEIKEELDPHEVKPEEPPEELIGSSNHFKIGDQVLLDKADPHITSTEPRAKGEIFLKVHDIFLHEIVAVSNPIFDTFKVNAS
ncbi:Transposon Ty3-I Gag-Pol polyprotein [Gossypium australe]|uniref:Transposon Ty3-I Gag-Pol polyprotein n=1 Tax=Gossypium australe TaxID=47621 RepID=A0A5B6WNP0_9ROSI|nr:Transposon Ty3-I Gag-Pol polyprotein [Gossypium australe]